MDACSVAVVLSLTYQRACSSLWAGFMGTEAQQLPLLSQYTMPPTEGSKTHNINPDQTNEEKKSAIYVCVCVCV